MATSLGVPAQPLISVVMPVYDGERYLAEAIRSILNQTYRHFEFIVVDDGSTDGSAAIVRDFAARDARIRSFFLAHGGQACALNAGIAAAQGELIALMEQDDIALPERFTIQLDWMRRTGVDICGGCLKSFGDADTLWWFPETHKAIRHELLFGSGFHLGSALLRVEIAKSHPYDEQAVACDYEMWTRLAPHYRMGKFCSSIAGIRSRPLCGRRVRSLKTCVGIASPIFIPCSPTPQLRITRCWPASRTGNHCPSWPIYSGRVSGSSAWHRRRTAFCGNAWPGAGGRPA